MWAPFKHFEKYFHRIIIHSVLIDDYSCWFFWFSLLLEAVNFTLSWGRRKDWLTKDWVQFYAVHCTEHVSVLIELSNRLKIFHVHSVSVDSIALFILPDVWWSYLNFFGHFNYYLYSFI